MKRLLACALLALFLAPPAFAAALTEDAVSSASPKAPDPIETSPPIALTSPSAILVEAGTGRAIFEKDADERRPVASVTKVMTILLTLEALDEGRVKTGDAVDVSEHAMSMGGSQAFLEAGHSYPLGELLKSMIVASANDAAVALAEHLDGTEEAFVRHMNARAQELGLTGTHYVNCTGLPAQGHYTTARDVASLSRRLDEHPRYYDYSTLWMDEIRHSGGRVTQLTNTNRLIRFYPGCDGYKTGSTNEARYCISATAKKDGMRLIAVVLGANASQTRFDEARAMLEYGFSSYRLFSPVSEGDALGMSVPVHLGRREEVPVVSGGGCSLLLRKGEESGVTLEAALVERTNAPVRAGDALGEVRVKRDGQIVKRLPAVAGETVELPGLLGSLLRIRDHFPLGGARMPAPGGLTGARN